MYKVHRGPRGVRLCRRFLKCSTLLCRPHLILHGAQSSAVAPESGDTATAPMERLRKLCCCCKKKSSLSLLPAQRRVKMMKTP